jgi:transposase InsO family protein
MILQLINETVQSGARLKAAAEAIGLSARTVIRWRQQDGGEDRRKGPDNDPANKLSDQERQQVLDIANSQDFRDISPKQIVPKLADQGVYIASESSFYRVLRDNKMMAHRQSAKPPRSGRPKGYVATGSCQVWTWDITFLQTTVRGLFFYLYMIVDIWSRKIVAAKVFEKESMQYSSRLFTQACMIHGVEPNTLVLHSDNGGPMKGSTMQATLQKLGVIPSFSRPKFSDDNPYSEALFRTMKYRPKYPSVPFGSIEDAQDWMDEFVIWYNTQHLHSAIRFVTPDDRHFGREEEVLANRCKVYEQARRRNPARWSGQIRNWNPVHLVCLNLEKKKGYDSMTQRLTRAA